MSNQNNSTGIILSIALKNIARHKLSSVVITFIVAISAFAAFWVLGFSNTFNYFGLDIYRNFFGDIHIRTSFTERENLAKYTAGIPAYKINYERRSLTMFDTAKKSGMDGIFEMTEKNKAAIGHYLKPVIGRLPVKDDELLMPYLRYHKILKVGEPIYLTSQTPAKVVNTIKYTIVGFARSMNTMLTEKGMDQLFNSTTHANAITIFLAKDLTTPEKQVKRLQAEIVARIKANGLRVKEATNIYDTRARLSILIAVFKGIKILLAIILFPLIGAVLVSIVWIYSYKRRGEIWTYVSLGLRDRTTLVTISLEYWIMAAIGITVGFLAGYLSSQIFEARNTWLHFGYMLNSPLIARVTALELTEVVIFIFATVTIWVRIPLMRIIRAKPFSF